MTSVRCTAGDTLTNATLPTQTAAYHCGGWSQIRSGGYAPGGDTAIAAFGTTGGSSQGFQIQVGSGATACTVGIFRAGGANFDFQDFLTGSDTAWFAWKLEYSGSGTAYTFKYRKEGATAWSVKTLDCGAALTAGGSLYLGTDQFAEDIVDGNVKGFWCQANVLSDAAALIASQRVLAGVAPIGTNLHWLDLDSATNAGVNGGTAGNWTVAGTLVTDASEPSEADTHLRAIGGYGGTNDVSADNTDHVISFTVTIGATNNRKVVLPVAYMGVTSGVTAITFNSSSTGVHLSAQQQSSLASLAGCDIYEILDADLPGAGTYTVSVTVDGAVGVVCGTPVYLEGVAQSYATNTGLATGTGTSITANLASNASVGSLLVGQLLDVSSGDAVTSGSGQIRLVAQATSSVIEQVADAKYVPSAGANSMSWSGLTNTTGKVAVVIEALNFVVAAATATVVAAPRIPRADLPPKSVVFTGVASAVAAAIGSILSPALRAPTPWGSAGPGLFAGSGDAAQVSVIVAATGGPPQASLPPKATLSSGFGNAAQVATITRAPAQAPSAFLAQAPAIFAGTAPSFAPAGTVCATAPPAYLAMLPPAPRLVAGAGGGQAVPAGVVAMAPIQAPAAFSPMAPRLLAGAVPLAAATTSSILNSPLAYYVELPPVPEVVAGYGQATQVASVQRSVAHQARLPPQPRLITGFGEAAPVASILTTPVAAPSASLPASLPGLFAGVIPAATTSGTIASRPQADYEARLPALLPSVRLGVVPAATTSGSIVSAPVVYFVDLPPVPGVIAGFGQFAQVAAAPVVVRSQGPFSAVPPPQGSIFAGAAPPPLVGAGSIFSAPQMGAPSVELPPVSAVVAGYGQASAPSQPIVICPPPLTLAKLPPRGGVLSGVAPPRVLSGVVQAAGIASALLPPKASIFAGFGQPTPIPAHEGIIRATIAYEPLPAMATFFTLGIEDTSEGAGLPHGLPRVVQIARARSRVV